MNPFSGGDAYEDDAAISLTGSRRNSVLSETTNQTSVDIFHANDGACFDHTDEETHHIDRVEAAVFPQASDVADKTHPRRSHYQEIREIVTRFWLWEVAACIFSLICLASIVGVLIYEDGKQLDQWSWSVPPTAVISLIGTMAKASLVLVLSQALSQLKWLYFRKARSLQHLRVFDSGSRGPLGAFWVMWSSRKPLVTIAAILMILTVLVDPFFQLVFTFPSRLVEDQSQQAIFQRVYDAGDIPTLSFWQGSNQGFVSNNISRTAICTSGNCIWTEPIRTIGLCGSCSDAGSRIQVNCSATGRNSTFLAPGEPSHIFEHRLTCDYVFDWQIPLSAQRYSYFEVQDSNNNIDYSYVTKTIWNATAWAGDCSFANNLTFVANKTRIQIDGHDDPEVTKAYEQCADYGQYPGSSTVDMINGTQFSFVAIQLPAISSSEGQQGFYNDSTLPQARSWICEISWCERVFEDIRVMGNAPLTYTTSTQPLWFISTVMDDTWLGFYPNEISSLNLSTVWNFKYHVQPFNYEYMRELFTSYYIDDNRPFIYGSRFADDKGPSYPSDNKKLNLIYNPAAVLRLARSDDINATINAIAEHLSEYIRTGPNATNVTGQALVDKSFIHVRWAWLALPLALVSITCVILTIVAIKSQSEEVAVWKDDPLALLFHHVEAVDVLSGSDMLSKSGPRDLDNLADEVHVRLDRDVPFTFVRSKA